jgi:methyl-coenzyme M reductase subunit D
VINGPGLPAIVPYGPARGSANPNTNRRTIQVCGATFEMKIQTGTVTLEVEDEGVFGAVKAVCDEFFTMMPYRLQTGRFMKTCPTMVDYARYGPDADERVIGLSDPRKRDGLIIIPAAQSGGSLSDNMQMENTPDSIN